MRAIFDYVWITVLMAAVILGSVAIPMSCNAAGYATHWKDQLPFENGNSPTIEAHAARVMERVRMLDEALKDYSHAYAVMALVGDPESATWWLTPAYGLMRETPGKNGKIHYEREWIILDVGLMREERELKLIHVWQIYELEVYYNKQEI